MVVEPTGKVAILYCAFPPLTATVRESPLPVVNVTVPFAAAKEDVTVAVMVAVWPFTEGLGDELTSVVVGAWLTVC